MALVDVPTDGRVVGQSNSGVGIGGAESNVAIGLARLGVDVHWVSRVGDDALGTLVTREIRAEGVRVHARRDPAAFTGLMVKEHTRGRVTHVRYYRKGSAAASLTPHDLPLAVIEDSAVLHLTGITPALGAGPLSAVRRAMAIARGSGTVVSLDVNYRSALWSRADAGEVLRDLIRGVDIVFASTEEIALLADVAAHPGPPAERTPEVLARMVAAGGPSEVVVKLGADGAYALAGDRDVRAGTVPVDTQDAVGAGDAFVVGYLFELLHGGDVPACLARGNVWGGVVCRAPGDWEGLPMSTELGHTEVAR